MKNSFKSEYWLNKLELREFPEPELISLRHPVLLCHGYGAIASLVKSSPLYDVAMLMRTHGIPCFAPNIVPYAAIETRARAWVDVMQQLSEKTGRPKFNVIAHSMGGLDIRYAVTHLEAARYIASFTTVATPHRGSSLAELVFKTPDSIKDKLADLFDWMGNRMYPKLPSDAQGAARQLTPKYVKQVFNPANPDLPDLPYYSYSAAVGKGTETPINALTKFQNAHVYDREGLNDGFVSVESARWGEHIGTAPLSHLEQMNVRLNEERTVVFRKFWKDTLLMLAERNY